MSVFLVTLRKELMEQRRTHRLLVVGVVLIVFGLLSPLAARYTPEMIKLLPNGAAMAQLIPRPTIMDAVGQYLKNVSQFGVVLALLVTMGAVAQEKDRGTAAVMLVKPLPRATFLVAKFAALAVTFSLSLLGSALAAYYYTMLLFHAPDPSRWLALNALALVYIMVHVAITLLCSVIAKSQAAAGGIAFAVIAAMGLIGTIPGFGEYLPGQLLGWAGGLLSDTPTAYWPALGVTLAIIAVSLAGAWWLFERQEL
ncbi:MAG: ABC transporter permease [Gemmatimonadota bacterium]